MQKKQRILKICVILLIIIALIGMWLIKHNTDKINDQRYNEILDDTEKEIPEHLQDADFSFEITTPVDFKAFSEYKLPLIVDFGADWCVPCQQMKPGYKNVSAKMQGKAFIKYIDTEKHPDAVADVPVSVIPTQIFFNADGTPFMPSEELSSRLEFSMYSKRDTGEHVYTVHQGMLSEDELYIILEEMGADIK